MAKFNLREAIAQAEAERARQAAAAAAAAQAAELRRRQEQAAATAAAEAAAAANLARQTGINPGPFGLPTVSPSLGEIPIPTMTYPSTVPPIVVTTISNEPPPSTIPTVPLSPGNGSPQPGYVPGPPLETGGGGGGQPWPENNIATDAWDYLRGVWSGDIATKVEAVAEEWAATPVDLQLATAVPEATAGTAFTIDALPAVAFAVAALLAEYINGWIIGKVADLFPNPSIFGFRPLGFINDGLNSLAGAIENNAKSQLHIVQSVLVTPTRFIIGLFQRLTNFGRATHNNVAHVVTTTIPMSVNDGVKRAEAYVTTELHNVAVQIQGAMDRLANSPSEAQAKTLIADAHRYGGIGWDVTAAVASAIVAADETAAQLGRNLQANINSTAKTVAQNAQTALDTVNTHLMTLLNADSTELTTLSTTVNTTLPTEIANKVAAAQKVDATNLTNTTLKLQGEIDTINSEIATLTSRINDDEVKIATAQNEITTLQGQQVVDTTAIDTQRQLIQTARSDIASNITTIADLNTKVTGISNTLAPVVAVQKLNVSQLAPFEGPGAIALPAVLATLSSTLSQVKTKVDTCMVDNCDPSSPNNIKNVLKDLLGLMTAAGEIGFIAEAILDPQGTANALAPILGSIDTGATDTWDALIGLL